MLESGQGDRCTGGACGVDREGADSELSLHGPLRDVGVLDSRDRNPDDLAPEHATADPEPVLLHQVAQLPVARRRPVVGQQQERHEEQQPDPEDSEIDRAGNASDSPADGEQDQRDHRDGKNHREADNAIHPHCSRIDMVLLAVGERRHDWGFRIIGPFAIVHQFSRGRSLGTVP